MTTPDHALDRVAREICYQGLRRYGQGACTYHNGSCLYCRTLAEAAVKAMEKKDG